MKGRTSESGAGSDFLPRHVSKLSTVPAIALGIAIDSARSGSRSTARKASRHTSWPILAIFLPCFGFTASAKYASFGNSQKAEVSSKTRRMVSESVVGTLFWNPIRPCHERQRHDECTGIVSQLCEIP